MTLSEIADALGVHPFRLEKLLDTCISLGFLQRGEGRYAHIPPSDECLVEGKPGYQGPMVYSIWSLLYDRSGKMEEDATKECTQRP